MVNKQNKIQQIQDQNETQQIKDSPEIYDQKIIQNFQKAQYENEDGKFDLFRINQSQFRQTEAEKTQNMEGGYQSVCLEQEQNINQFRFMDIIKRIKLKMIASKLINSTRSRMLKNMSSSQFQFLNDKSQDFSDTKNGQISSTIRIFSKRIFYCKIFKQAFQFIDKLPVINPASLTKKIWDTLIAIVLLFSFFIIPIKVSLGLDEHIVLLNSSIEVILVCNVLDVFIQANTGFYEHGILCKDRKQIRKKYYQSQYTVDLISILPLVTYRILQLNLKQQIQYYQFITLSIFIRWKSQIKVYKNLQQSYILQQKVRDFLSLLDLFLKVLFIAHICACIWIFTSRLSEFIYGNSWIQKNQLLNKSWENQYLDSFYFSTVTMSTVGYGDIVPVTNIEILVCILMVLFASGVFGFSITTINGILESFYKEENQILQKLFIIKNYLQKKSISGRLQRDITEYLEYVWRQEQQNYSEEENSMIKMLPNYLKNQLYEESNKILLKESPILQNNFSEDLLKAILPIIKERSFTPNELILQQNEESLDTFLYFIQQGQAENFIQLKENEKNDQYLKKNSQKLLKTFNKGDYFGEIEFFTGRIPEINVKSINFTTLLVLSRKDFLEILQKFPQDQEQYCLIRDKIIFGSDYSKIFHKCFSCKSQKHTVFQCPYIHFTYDINKIIAFQNKTEKGDKPNKDQKTPLRSEFKCKYKKLDLQEITEQYQDENEESIDFYIQQHLNYSISYCDVCPHVKKGFDKKSQQIQFKDYQPQQSQNTLNDQIDSQNSHHLHETKKNQSQFYIPHSNLINQEDHMRDKKKQQNSYREIIEQENVNKPQKTQQKQKNPIFHESELNFKRQDSNLMNQQQNSSLKLISLQNVTNQQQSLGTDIEFQVDQYFSRSNNQINFSNQQNSNIQQGQQNFVRSKRYSHKSNFHIQDNSHTQIQNLDIFQGSFEKLKCFNFYFPLSNYDLVIKQIYLSTEQKKIMQLRMLEKQKQKIYQLLSKRKKSINLNVNYPESIKSRSNSKYQDTIRTRRSVMNTIIYNQNTSLQQSQFIKSPLSLHNKQSKNNLGSQIFNQSNDLLEEYSDSKLKLQNFKMVNDSQFLIEVANTQDISKQFFQKPKIPSIKWKMDNQNHEISSNYDQNILDKQLETQQNDIQSKQKIQFQRRDEEIISSSPMIESKIKKFNFSQIPSIDVSKYNNSKENQDF